MTIKSKKSINDRKGKRYFEKACSEIMKNLDRFLDGEYNGQLDVTDYIDSIPEPYKTKVFNKLWRIFNLP